MIGDAFGTVCPAAGTGVVKALNDTELLCGEFIPRWLSTPGMGAEKISQFYNCPQKQKCDRETLKVSIVARRTAVDRGLHWRVRRTARLLKRSANALRIRLTSPTVFANRGHSQVIVPVGQPVAKNT